MNTQPLYAGLWRRLFAFCLDSILFFFICSPVLYLAYGIDYFQWLFENDSPLAIYGAVDLLLDKIGYVLFVLFFWIRTGATPGKSLAGCRVVDAQTYQLVSPKQAMIRLLGYVVSALPAYLGFAWIAVDKRKQGLHDKLAKTVVLRDEDDYSQQSLQQLMQKLV